MILLELFWSFFQIGLFSVGGGYAAMPLIQAQVVELHPWLSLTEFTDLITIAEMTPGPIAINSATFVGTRIAGLAGAIVATVGCITPSCMVVSLLAYLYFRYSGAPIIQGILSGLRPAVVALIASAGLSVMSLAFFGEEGFRSLGETNWISVALFAVAFAVLRFQRRWKISPIHVMLGSGIIGGLVYLIL